MLGYLLATLRSALFYGCFTVLMLVWAALNTVFGSFLPAPQRFSLFIAPWARIIIWITRWLLGIQYRLRLPGHLPDKAVVVCNHQSVWETLFLQTLFVPQSQVIKKSLLNIPFFGWSYRLTKPIAIDRSNPRSAAQQVLDQGKSLLKNNVRWYILIFPEGTRCPPDNLGRFSRGGAMLAKQAGVPLIPVSQNSGKYWINKGFTKYPGIVDVVIHEPLDVSNMTAEQATSQAKWIIAESLCIPSNE